MKPNLKSIKTLNAKVRVLPEGDVQQVIFYAGHGGRVFDKDGNEIDKIDENLCMREYDSLNINTYVLDDEFGTVINSAFEAAPFLRIYIVLDSCHSGTATRATEDILR